MTDILSALFASVQRFPHAIAIRHGDRDTSYEQLWRGVQRAAETMRGLGIQPGDRVAICLENSVDYVEAFYGALAAQAIAVPLAAQAPLAELSRALQHSGARCLVMARSNPHYTGIDMTAERGLNLIAIEDSGSSAGSRPVSNQSVTAIPDASVAAAILYTSGTTGAPKGVTLSHANLTANTEAILKYLELGPNDNGLCVLPFHYAYGNSILHTHLAAGARLVLENSLAYPHRVAGLLSSEKITGMSGVPSTWTLLLTRARLKEAELPALRYVTIAGGALPGDGLRALQHAMPRTRIFVMYGQTEATARITWLPPDRMVDKAGSAGVPVQGMEVEIRDADGRILAHGETGEIRARGTSVMLGYWQDPLTTSAVLQDGWLHTGDMGYLDADGYLFIAGRRSDMIKVGSHRVNPAEIEEVILQLDGIAEAAVIGAPDPVLGQVIKAVVATHPGASVPAMSVQSLCRARLAPHKVPRVVEFVEQLPRTASGKIKRAMLA